MPSKKKPEAQPEAVEPVGVVPQVLTDVLVDTFTAGGGNAISEPALCGHTDRHSLGPDGKPDNPTCTLPKGHTGDHRGVHLANVEVDRIHDMIYGKLIKIVTEVQEVPACWNDAAGVPAKDIKLGPMPKRDGGMQDALRKTIQELMQA